jgi:hypothetical protein
MVKLLLVEDLRVKRLPSGLNMLMIAGKTAPVRLILKLAKP